MKLIFETAGLGNVTLKPLCESHNPIHQACYKLVDLLAKFEEARQNFDSALFGLSKTDKEELGRGATYWFFDAPPPEKVTVENFKAMLDSFTTDDNLKNFILSLALQTQKDLLRESSKVYSVMTLAMPDLDWLVLDDLHQHDFERASNGDLLLKYFNYIRVYKYNFDAIMSSDREYVVGEISATIRITPDRYVAWDECKVTFNPNNIRQYTKDSKGDRIFHFDGQLPEEAVAKLQSCMKQLKKFLQADSLKGLVERVDWQSFKISVADYVKQKVNLGKVVQSIMNFNSIKFVSPNFNNDSDFEKSQKNRY